MKAWETEKFLRIKRLFYGEYFDLCHVLYRRGYFHLTPYNPNNLPLY